MGGLTAPASLSTEHGREAFDCERKSLNHWFQRHAWANHQANVSRVSVVCDQMSGAIAGYVALSSSEIRRELLPKPVQRNKPASIPILLLGQLAVDRNYRGRGIAASLLAFTFRTAIQISKDVGCFGVVVHPLDDEARAFYARFDFKDLSADPKRSMIARTVDLDLAGF
jgi:predicted N-acetyltransferase YhbS